MLLRPIDPSSGQPLHQQVAASVRRAIIEEAAVGERLPTAADIAAALGVNANTALRALRALRDEGVVEFRRGRGVTVTPAAKRQGRMAELVEQVVDESQRSGYSLDEVIEMIRRQIDAQRS